MLDRAVVGHQVQQDLEVVFVGRGDERVEGGEVAVVRVDVAVVGHVVPVVGLW
jgi:hypothetical protein